jgi:NADPH-dependent ferric siderophore reductase
MRLGAGAWAAATGQGEVGKFPGLRGKIQAALALLKGDLAALPLIPRMLAKRRAIDRIRKLSPREVRKLILEHRIPLKQLMRQAV